MGKIVAKAKSKLILLGEHVVLYGYPAIGIPLEKELEITWEPFSKSEWNLEAINLSLHRDLLFIIDLYEKAFPILKKNRGKLTIRGQIAMASGFGSSASLCVALSRLVNHLLNLSLSEEEIWLLAHQGEKVFHGNPSGIDTGIIALEKSISIHQSHAKETLPSYQSQKFSHSWYLLIGSLPRKQSVKEIIQNLKGKFHKDRFFQDRVHRLGELSQDFVLLNKNEISFEEMSFFVHKSQKILKELCLSHKDFDSLLERTHNEFGLMGKMSGAGKGGAFYFLVPSEKEAILLRNFLLKEAEKEKIIFNEPLFISSLSTGE